MKCFYFHLVFCILFFLSAYGQENKVFTVAPLGKSIYEGVFTGNGLLGTMTYSDIGRARIDIGRTDVYDHRTNMESALFDKARLPIGHFELLLPGYTQKAWGNMDYLRAEATAYYEQNGGVTQVKTVSFAEEDLIYIEISTTDGERSNLQWKGEKAKSSRWNFGHAKKPEQYTENPEGYEIKRLNVEAYVQPLLAGGGYTLAYKKISDEYKDIYLVTVSYSQSSEAHIAEAIQKINDVDINSLSRRFESHKKWWKDYYDHSSLSVPDNRLQQFYNMQLYKLACATRFNKPAIDLQGPWTSNTPWPAYWNNLNVQLTYSPTFAANHLHITESLIRMIDRNVDNLVKNVPEQYRYNSAAIGRSSSPDMISPVYLQKGVNKEEWEDGEKELGNLTWMLHSYYQYYRYSMDSAAYDRLFPLLKRAINYYIHLLEKDERGNYHIAVRTYSPEYAKAYAYDTNYDLSILRWGLKTLIALDNERSGMDAQHLLWVDVLKNIRPYPQDSNGFMIAKDLPYAESHRHYSHLMMIYPFYDINWDQVENHDLIMKSISHWQSKPGALQGYSFSGVASMYAMMGRGDLSLKALNVLLDKYVKVNTLYAETGPVIETPLAAMASIQEMVLQYWNGYVRVFPAIPVMWENVSFERFLTDGAFLISAKREFGKTVEIRVESQHTGKVGIQHDMQNMKIRIAGKGEVLRNEKGKVELWLEKSAQAIFSIN